MLTHSRRARLGLIAAVAAIIAMLPLLSASPSHAASSSSVSVAAKKPGPATKYVPCTSCTYWAAWQGESVGHPNEQGESVPITLRGYVEHVVYANGKDHIRNIAFAGEDRYGPFAWDRVRATMRHGASLVRIGDPVIWDPAYRFGEAYVGRDNGMTGYGVEVLFEGWWRDQYIKVRVRPKQVVEGNVDPLRIHRVGPAGVLRSQHRSWS